jgi:hypothetical protein
MSGVPLQLYWSAHDRVIVDQRQETGRLADELLADRPAAPLWDFSGDWVHTAEMRSTRRLPRALARFGLLPWRDVPPLDVVLSAPSVNVAAFLASEKQARQGRREPR